MMRQFKKMRSLICARALFEVELRETRVMSLRVWSQIGRTRAL